MLIVEDHVIARLGVTAIVDAQSDMKVIAEAANGEQGIARYREHIPDVVLMDMVMPVLDGFDAVAAIRREFSGARIIALSTYGGEEDIHRAFAAGVKAYLTKDVLHHELIQAIRTVCSGGDYLTPSVRSALAAQSPRAELSERELDVLRLIVSGQSNKQIAFGLAIAEHTVKNHVKSILSKLEVDHRTQAATVAIQRGIVHL